MASHPAIAEELTGAERWRWIAGSLLVTFLIAGVVPALPLGYMSSFVPFTRTSPRELVFQWRMVWATYFSVTFAVLASLPSLAFVLHTILTHKPLELLEEPRPQSINSVLVRGALSGLAGATSASVLTGVMFILALGGVPVGPEPGAAELEEFRSLARGLALMGPFLGLITGGLILVPFGTFWGAAGHWLAARIGGQLRSQKADESPKNTNPVWAALIATGIAALICSSLTAGVLFFGSMDSPPERTGLWANPALLSLAFAAYYALPVGFAAWFALGGSAQIARWLLRPILAHHETTG